MIPQTPFFRNLLIYAICLPLAVVLGYLLAQPLDLTSLVLLLIVAAVIALPFILKYHHLLLILALNSGAVVFFLPGRMQLWIVLLLLTLLISIFRKTLSPETAVLHAPGVFWPLIAIAGVTLITAELTGGINFRSMGGGTMGGRRYFEIFMSILAYFALVSCRVPPRRAALYVGLYFLGAVFTAIGSLSQIMDHPVFNYVFLLFPPEAMPGASAGTELGNIRFAGLGLASFGVFLFIIARFGLRGILLGGKPLRLLALGVFFILALFGGFRSMLILMLLVLGIQFWLEGLTRTRLFPTFLLLGFLASVVVLPFASRPPFTVQRTLAFLPVNVDPAARLSASATTEWRIRMWSDALPEIPKYLLLGKGYAINALEMERAASAGAMAAIPGAMAGSDFRTFSLASDYHSGPLTLLIPLGIWGAIAFLWFLVVAVRTLYSNFKYGDPVLRTYNTLLLAIFLAHVVMFLAVFGSFYSELIKFTGLLGLSVSLNGGVSRPGSVRAPVVTTDSNSPLGLGRPRPAMGKST